MAVDTKHPEYIDAVLDWIRMRDCYEGERSIKDAGMRYLPPTKAMRDDGLSGVVGEHRRTSFNVPYSYEDDSVYGNQFDRSVGARGFEAYHAYRLRARFPDWVREAVDGLLGVMHSKPAKIELPPSMEPLRDMATDKGESLQQLLQRITREQLIVGRVGLLGDVQEGGERDGQPYVAVYDAEAIINWDDGNRSTGLQDLNLVVLDESDNKRDGFQWRMKTKHRVLSLFDPLLGPAEQIEEITGTNPQDPDDTDGDSRPVDPVASGTYRVYLVSDETTIGGVEPVVPNVRGNDLQVIPFQVINVTDVVSTPERPPLLGLGNLAISHYRSDADYRQSLFMQGQDTLVIRGSLADDDDGETRVGAGAVINVTEQGGAEYVGVNSEGLSEQRLAIQDDRQQAAQMSGQMADATSRERESGDALKVRVAARTATVKEVAIAAAFGLQEFLRKLAPWFNASPDEINVEPNLDFVDDTITGRELLDLVTARSSGAPLSLRSLHALMTQKGLTSMPFEEEIQTMMDENEDPEIEEATGAGGGSTNEDGPVPPDEIEDDDVDEPDQEDDDDEPDE